MPLSKNSSYTNVITSNTRYLQPSNSNQSSTVKSPTGTNYAFMTSQSSVSSTSNINKGESYVNLDAFKKSSVGGSEQYQSEPPRFQFRTSNNRPDM